MIHYILINENGEIIQRGGCSAVEDIPLIAGCSRQIIDELDARRPKTSPDPTYKDMRRMSYPGVGDQLDAIWKALGGLELPPGSNAAALLEKIKAVKQEYPKDANS